MYDKNRGYGFLFTRRLPNEVFFHISDVKGRNAAKRDQWLRFPVRETDKGYHAENLERIPSRRKESTLGRRKPPVDVDAIEEPADSHRLERQQWKARSRERTRDDGGSNPFTDDVRGSKNDLLS